MQNKKCRKTFDTPGIWINDTTSYNKFVNKVLGTNAFVIQGDLTKVPNVRKLFDETLKHFGKIDSAINTTGLVIKKPICWSYRRWLW